MATLLKTASFPKGNGPHFYISLELEITGQDYNARKTYGTFYLYMSSKDNYSGSGAAIQGYVSGQNIGSISSVGKNEKVLVGALSTEITHSDDGTANWYYSASVVADIWGLGTAYLEGWYTVPTIPVKSTVTCTNGDIESSVSININKASESFTHTLRYKFGSLEGTIVSKTTQNSYGWTIPSSFYAQIPNSKSGTCTIYCDTYNGNNALGTTSTTAIFTANATKSQPTLSAAITDTNSVSVALTGDNTKLVKFVSTARVVSTATAKNSSTIKSITAYNNNTGKTGSDVSFAKVEGSKFVITAVDSRNYSTSITKTPTIVNYLPLSLTAEFSRKEPTTGEVVLNATGQYFNGSFGAVANTLTLKYRYKESTSQSWSSYKTITPTITSGKFTVSNLSLGTGFDYRKIYNFQLVATDKVGSAPVVSQTVAQGVPMIGLFEDIIEIFGTDAFTMENNQLRLNKDIYIGDTGKKMSDITDFYDRYSTISTERQIVGKTDDNKTIYRKTFKISSVPSHQETYIDVDEDIDYMIDLYGSYTFMGFRVPINFYNSGSVEGSYCFYNQNKQLTCSADFENTTNWIITIVYTIK